MGRRGGQDQVKGQEETLSKTIFVSFRLTEVEHVRRRDEGHEVDSRGEGHHSDQDERSVSDAAAKQHDTQKAGEENGAAGCVSVTHLKGEHRSSDSGNTT